MKKRWTEKEWDYLRINHSSKTNKEISKVLGRSEKSIRYVASKLGLKKHPKTISRAKNTSGIFIDAALIKQLYWNTKLSTREIAKKLKLSSSTIEYYLKKFDINRRSPSEANKNAAQKYGNWRLGLTKNNDSRVAKATKKMKETRKRQKLERLKNKEMEIGKTLKEAINHLYWRENLTQKKIAKRIGISRCLIIELMKKFDISKKPNFRVIANLKGKNHPLYGKKWEDIYGKDEARRLKKEMSLRSRKAMIRRLQNNEMPFANTKIEIMFAEELSKRDVPFMAQYPIGGRFVCDFAIPKFKIIIECDGDYWHANPKIYDKNLLDKRQKINVYRDNIKDKFLKERGWKIMRFFETDIQKSVSDCVNKIEPYFK